ncbi:MAG TPA: helix-turn-helix transcriptional regulator [Nitrospira sp.]|nr:helix-turn-helix transcriptional regulator [Nitrospira sp.]
MNPPRSRSSLSKQLGACIRDLRLQTGLSQVEFGERCGFYQTYLSRIENGRANPTLNAVEVIANTLGLTVFELLDQVREKMPPKRQGRKSGRVAKDH